MADQFYLRILGFFFKCIRKTEIILIRRIFFSIIKHDKMGHWNL